MTEQGRDKEWDDDTQRFVDWVRESRERSRHTPPEDDGALRSMTVGQLVLAVRMLDNDAPVLVIDAEKQTPVPYRVGVGFAESSDGDSAHIFVIVVGGDVMGLDQGAILFGGPDPL